MNVGDRVRVKSRDDGTKVYGVVTEIDKQVEMVQFGPQDVRPGRTSLTLTIVVDGS